MIKEQELINFCESEEEFKKVIKQIVKNFEDLGLSLVRTTYKNKKYYVLTKPGKDSKISPSMYGILAMLISTYNELGADIPLVKIKQIFRNVWDDIDLLIEEGYLNINQKRGEEHLVITPLAKASFKDIIKDLDLKRIMEMIEKE